MKQSKATRGVVSSVYARTKASQSLGAYDLDRAIRALPLLCCAAVLIGAAYVYAEPAGVSNAVTINGKSYAGLTFPDFKSALEADVRQRLNTPLRFACAGKTFKATASELGVDATPGAIHAYTRAALAKAWLHQREPNLKMRWVSRFSGPLVLQTHIIINTDVARCIIREFAFKRPRVVSWGRQPVINGGERFSDEAVQTSLQSTLNNSFSAASAYQDDNAVVMVPEHPIEKWRADIITMRARAEIRLKSNSPGARNNMLLAARALNGRLVDDEHEASFNGMVGARTMQKGYVAAPVIDNGLPGRGIGGGVCRAATVLFDAALHDADIEIRERQNHSFPSSYALPGYDATVMLEKKQADLKLVNHTGGTIALRCYTTTDGLAAEIWGRPTKAVTQTTTSIQRFPGQMRVTLYRKTARNGKTQIESYPPCIYRVLSNAPKPAIPTPTKPLAHASLKVR